MSRAHTERVDPLQNGLLTPQIPEAANLPQSLHFVLPCLVRGGALKGLFARGDEAGTVPAVPEVMDRGTDGLRSV